MNTKIEKILEKIKSSKLEKEITEEDLEENFEKNFFSFLIEKQILFVRLFRHKNDDFLYVLFYPKNVATLFFKYKGSNKYGFYSFHKRKYSEDHLKQLYENPVLLDVKFFKNMLRIHQIFNILGE